MDELKLYNSLTDTVKSYSNDIKMIFGFDKCTITNIRKGEMYGYGETVARRNTTSRNTTKPGS